MKIKKRSINIKKPPFIIAEMSGNHNHSFERALKIVKKSKNQVLMLLNYKLIHLKQ